ncbi:MAG: hypothetical protein ISR50_10055 [Alphaproteobacteria bacterium]|nr:hypothetical protein [Alphaproteobacteria bacterium]
MILARSRLLVVLALVTATLVLFGLVERYQVRQPQLLQNGDFSNGLSGWQKKFDRADQLQLDQGILRIRSVQAGQSPGIRQIIERDPGMDHVRLSAWVRHTGVAPGLRIWNTARLLLAQRNSHGDRLWELPHMVNQGRGDSPWRRVSAVFWLPAQVNSVEIIAELSQVAGQMQVRDLSLEVVQEFTAFTMARYGLVAVWLLALPWLILPLYRPGPARRRRLAVVLLGAIILAGVLLPQTAKTQVHRLARDVLQSDWVASIKAMQAKPKVTARPAAKAPASTTDGSVRIVLGWLAAQKLGHVGFFALLALTVTLTWRRQPWQRLCLYLSTFAVAAETLQLLSLDRNATPMDAGLNLLGTAAGLALGFYMIRVAKSLRPRT